MEGTKAMTPEQKRIKIAEACGWEEIPWSELINPRVVIEAKRFCQSTEQFRCLWLPDYLNDLNAMQEALYQRLNHSPDTETQMECQERLTLGVAFRRKLQEVVARAYSNNLKSKSQGCVEFATAEELAEAFGLTLNLWTA